MAAFRDKVGYFLSGSWLVPLPSDALRKSRKSLKLHFRYPFENEIDERKEEKYEKYEVDNESGLGSTELVDCVDEEEQWPLLACSSGSMSDALKDDIDLVPRVA